MKYIPFKPKNTYKPNRITIEEWVKYISISLALIGYGTFGVIIDDILLPGKRGVVHFKGLPCWIIYAAMLMAALSALSVIVDHYDKRNNERSYKDFAQTTKYFSFGLFIIATILEILYIFLT